MEQWRENIKALAQKNKRLADELERIITEDETSDVEVFELDDGHLILGFTREEHTWYLNSKLDPEGVASIYADRYEIQPFYRYLFFGISDGLVFRQFMDRCDTSNVIIICEPDKYIMAEAMKYYDFTDIFEDERVWPCISEMWEDMYNVIYGTVDYSHMKLIEFCILPGYDVLYPKECEKFMDEVIDRMRNEMVYKNTCVGFNRMIPKHILFNMRNMIKQRNFAQIRQRLDEIGIEDIPAIVISAGPSLDKNIKEVKKAQGKAFLIVVDAALRTVIREGIQPDMVCTIDPEAPDRFFESVGENEFLWACGHWTNPSVLKQYGNKVFYYNSVVPWWDEIIREEISYEYPKIESGGCVSADAFQLARYLGFKTIIFIGQDLAFTDSKAHTNGIEGILGENDAYIQSRYLVQVEDYNGNMLDTDFQMHYYKMWFDKVIPMIKDEICVIDATEGGALLKGTVVKTLKEAIEENCKEERNFYNIIKEISPAFSIEQQKRLCSKIGELKDQQKDFIKELQKGIQLQKELKTNNKKYSGMKVAQLLKKIQTQTDVIDKHPFLAWITMYAKAEEFDLQDNICAKAEIEIEEIMERSIRLFESYQAGIPLFEEDYEEAMREN